MSQLTNQAARPVAVIGGIRIPFARSNTAYVHVGNQAMLSASAKGLVEAYNLAGETLGDTAMGATIKHSSDWNLAREVVLDTKLDPHTPGITMQRACGTSLDTTIMMGNKIALGQIVSGLAGGVDTTSEVPIVYRQKFANRLLDTARAKSFKQRLAAWKGFRPGELKPSFPGVAEPRTGMSMGQHTELMAKEWGLSQAEQDQLAFESHIKAAAAWDRGFYDDLVVPYRSLLRDNNLRPDTSLEKLASLKPAFDKKSGAGTLTAGNSTPLTDGASTALLASEDWAKERDLPVRAYLTHSRVAAVDFVEGGEGLLMAPTYAVANMLQGAGITLQDFDFYEIHEAFAAQVLATLKAWESEEYCMEKLGLDAPLGSVDRSKLNVVGSSIALGHPFAATGTRIVATLAKLLEERGSGRGLISICTAGGMGVVAILER